MGGLFRYTTIVVLKLRDCHRGEPAQVLRRRSFINQALMPHDIHMRSLTPGETQSFEVLGMHSNNPATRTVDIGN